MDEKPVFLTKQQREQLALERLQQKRLEQEKKTKELELAHDRFITGKAIEEKKRDERLKREEEERERERRKREENIDSVEHDHEVQRIRDYYLGGTKQKRLIKPSERFTKVFQFEWNETDDTARDDLNPLYQNRIKLNAMYGRGYIAGVDRKEQRKDSNFFLSLSEKRFLESKLPGDEQSNLTEDEKLARERAKQKALEEFRKHKLEEIRTLQKDESEPSLGKHWSEKSLSEMTERDWRIFREDFDIRIQGGRATLPLRFWRESNIPQDILKAIDSLGYEKPSPIQRQAIPIGLAFKDLIGIAETGSGKTIAFLVPLLCYLLHLPPSYSERCKDQGPLALVMAPTRELAEQIDKECKKILKFTKFSSTYIVGGQSFDEQGLTLRNGVEIVIGTPGRLIDCLKNNILVLNQCNYVVLDEADRMIDMGFEPQVVEVLEEMGGLLKSEDELQAELQEKNTQLGNSYYRVTAMFSATMSPEVEVIAKKYLRHPVIVKIGDEESGKNKRIEQRVFFLAESQKKGKLVEELRALESNDKIIIFINSKKSGDSIGWQLENLNYEVGILHGGKSQEQREETLEMFRTGEIKILVATDVAGRGLDIPDVSHVINYDCPNKIQSYCHRIGRTGRAGKFGVATTFLTDADSEVMFDLKNYLESTDSAIPHQLLHHPAAQAPVGTRDEKGRLLNAKKEGTQYIK